MRNARFVTVDRALAVAERRIALTERCHPANFLEEQRRVVAAWRAGARTEPRWCYPPRPELGDVEGVLEAVVAHLLPETRGADGPPASAAVWAQLYVARASELLLEASLVRAIGTSALAASAGMRFAVGDVHVASRARDWAERWAREPLPAPEPTVASDDEGDPQSLVSALRRVVGLRRLPVRVEVRADLASAAAASDEVVLVQAGLDLRERDVERIVAHELEAHVVPRLAARRAALGLMAVGTARAEDEEGRALALEQRTRGFDALRRVELGRRHLAAMAVRGGATWVEAVDTVLETGADLEQAAAIASRCCRGGGLAREVIYLTALVRYEEALAAGVPLERWMSRGRIGIAAATRLHACGVVPDALPSPEAA